MALLIEGDHNNTQMSCLENSNDVNVEEDNFVHNIHKFLYKPTFRFKYVATELKERKVENNFYKGVKWSQDGTCLLTCLEDGSLRLLELCSFYKENFSLKSVFYCKEAELVYDYCWYPLMSSWEPVTACFLSTSRDSPIHLWDAFNGTLRCTYRAYNHLDELEAANSVSFNLDGSKIYCGFKNKFCVFETAIPGRTYSKFAISETTKRGIMKGIISCFSFSKMAHNLCAAGSYTGFIGLFDLNSKDNFICSQKPTQGGVTQLATSSKGYYLLAGCRKDDNIYCYDFRRFENVLFSLPRSAPTNQRLYFDISHNGAVLATGSRHSECLVYSLEKAIAFGNLPQERSSDCLLHRFHVDGSVAVNGAALHPFYSLLAVSTGERQFDFDSPQNNYTRCADAYGENFICLFDTK